MCASHEPAYHQLSFEGLELVDAPQAVVCGVKLTRAARGKDATAGAEEAEGEEHEENGDSEEQSNE